MPDPTLPEHAGDRLRTAAHARAGTMAERLRGYVELETPTGDAPALNAFADLLIDAYTALGATARREPAPTGDHVVAEFSGSGERADSAPLLCVGHHDTVWPKLRLAGPVRWRVEESADGRTTAFGPGVFDMKGGLVVLETALALLRETGIGHRPVRAVVVADEEIGSPTSQGLVARCAEGVAAALGFESPHGDGALKHGRRGSTRLRLRVRGRAAHAALDPEKGASAIDELVDQLIAVRALVADHADSVLCNVGAIDAPGKTNVVPDAAAADIGLRFADPGAETAVLDGIRALRAVREGAAVEVETLSRRATWAPGDEGDALLSAVRAAARAVGQDIGAAPAAGAADTNAVGARGVPTLDGFGPLGAGAHADHEQAVLDSLPERAALVAAAIATV
ncbi:glutamate carboxypeptidase [Murinocardiopsis flavida]|uniref:Glutamate carboxypeptidase n=1 Tax=Murinocardiopsis flavida TaxID=645275 RepID=A0A2P8CVD3_9ACTN|nr:M20/M25/M40 family metallo-hydrolase [Murinocardiopsis flavida]PSK88917.1 glutamate carboxypeptidase [Murinocardiopsis flavida]